MPQHSYKRFATLAVLVAIPIAGPLLLRGKLAMPLSLRECATIQEVRSVRPDNFSVEGLLGKDGRAIYGGNTFADLQGGHVCGLDDSPISLYGKTQLPDDANVWLISTSDRGRQYLSPRLRVLGGDWVATDIRMGSNIVKFQWVQVDATADRALRAQVADNEWAASWPASAVELAAMSIAPVR